MAKKPEAGFDIAKTKMDPRIREAICNDIGVDEPTWSAIKIIAFLLAIVAAILMVVVFTNQ